MQPLTIARALGPTADVRALIAELDTEMARNYRPEQCHGLSLDAIFEPHVRFFTADRGAGALGCGGVAMFADFAEIKRMYVREAARGTGVAQALLAHLESEARSAGKSLLRLETGDKQLAAIRLYERFGFRECPAFGDYRSLAPGARDTSVFYEKLCEAV